MVDNDELARSRRTIGLLIDNALDPVAWSVWAGAEAVTKQRDVNLLCIVGGPLGSDADSTEYRFLAGAEYRHLPGVEGRSREGADPANVVYDLVDSDNVDALVIWARGLGQSVTQEDVLAFCERYRPLPVVSAGVPLEGIPSVLVDTYAGARQALAHLLDVHGYRRIAFVRGPEGHPEADERYRAYVDALTEFGLAHNPSLVVPGHFHPGSGVESVQVLLDERGLTPGTDVEALVAVNDAAAIQAVEELQARGIRVPREVAVIGFDNTESSAAVSPPLTTVPSLAYEQARRATEMALASMDGAAVPERVMLPADLIVRQSCGCLDPVVAHADMEPAADRDDTLRFRSPDRQRFPAGQTLETVLTVQRGRILSQMVDAAGAPVEGLDPRWAEHLLAVFAVEVAGEAPGVFLSTLDRTLGRVVRGGGNAAAWQNVISTLRQSVGPALLNDAKALSRAENLWQQARVMVAGAAERSAAYRALQTRRHADLLREIDQALMTAANVAGLADVLAQRLPQLGAASCYLSLYPDPAKPADMADLILAYGPQGHVEVGAGEQRFLSRELAPGGIYRRSQRYSMVLDPLVFQDDPLGFALLEFDPAQAELHAPLPRHLSSALYRLTLVQQEARHALQLQTGADVSRAAGSILEVDELIRQAVNLIHERFDLYYVGLFLIDESGEWTGEPGTWAVLRAGTGEPGEAMVAAGHKLKVGSESMIGWCIANAQARIALDVGDVHEPAVRFDNPLLPLTRSEMALPFISRGRVIGAMTIQSDRPVAFTSDDITALQTMADQLANSIENARLFEGRERRITELSIVNEIGHALGTALTLDELLENVHRQVKRLFDTTNFYIATYEEGSEEWLSAFHLEGGERQPTAWHPVEIGLTGFMLRNPQPLLFHTAHDIAVFHEREGMELLGAPASSWLGVPILAADKIMGVMAVQNYDHEWLYDEQHLALFSTVAAQVATALDNLRLLEATRQRAVGMEKLHQASQQQARRRALLNDMSEALNRATGLQEILDIAMARTAQIFPASRVSVAMLTGNDERFEIHTAHGDEGAVPGEYRFRDGVGSQWAAEDRLIDTAVREQRLIITPNEQSVDLGGVRSSMVAPLTSGRGAIGTLNVGGEQPDAFDQDDGDLLMQVASLLSSAIENTRLLEETRQRLHELTMLSSASQALADAPFRSDEIVDILVRQFAEVMGVPEASVSLLDKDGDIMHVVLDLFAEGGDAVPDRSQESFRRSDYPATARVMETGVPMVVHASDPSADDAELAYMREFEVMTLVIIPLTVKGQAIGVVELEVSDGERHYTPSELDMAVTLANQAAVALENARLFEEAQISARDQATLRRVTAAVSRSLETKSLLDTTIETVLEALGFDAVLASLVEEESGRLYLAAQKGLPEPMARTLRQDGLANTLCEQVFQKGETLAIGDVRAEGAAGAPVNVEGVIEQGLYAYVGVPLIYQDRRIGTICAFGRSPREFSARELMLLEGIAAQVGVGVANAQLFEEIRRRLQELETINEIGRTITSVLDVDAVLRQVVDITRTRFGYYHASIMLVEGGHLVFRGGSTIGDSDDRFEPGDVQPYGTIAVQSDRSLSAEAVRTGQPVLVNDALDDPRFLPIAELPDTRAELDVPIEVKGQVIGVLGVQSDRPFAFDETDVALLRSLANHVGIAIDNARLFGQEQNASLQLGQRVQELNILNDIGRKIDESPAIPDFLQWVTGRIPLAMQRPEKCVSAIEYDDHLYGVAQAVHLPHQIVQGLYASGERVGRLYIAYTEETDFVNIESALMGDISRRVSGYIENRQLLDETQRRVREIQMLYEVGTTAAAGTRLDETLQAAVEAVATGMRYPIVGVELVDPDSRTLRIEASVGYPLAAVTDLPLPLGEGITGWVAQHGEPLLVSDVRQDGRYVETVSHTCSEMCVPLFIGSEIVGVLNVESPRPGAFSAGDLRLLSTVATNLSAFVERARFFDEARVRAEELAVLNELSHALTARLSVEEVLNETYRQVSRLLDTTSFYIGLYDQDRDEIRFVVDYAHGAAYDAAPILSGTQGLAGHIINSRQPLLIEKDVTEYQEAHGIEAVGEPALCYLGVPLMVGDQVLGAMAVQSYTTPRLYGEHERELLTAIAGSVGIAFQNARLFAETEESLVETETLYAASRLLASASDLQEVVAAVTEGVRVPVVNRAVLWGIERGAEDQAEALTAWANWYGGKGTAPLPLGTRFPVAQFPATSLILASEPIFVDNIPENPQIDPATKQAFAQQNTVAMAVLPLWLGRTQTGALMLIAEEPHHFTADEIRPYRSLTGQVAIAVENRRLFQQTQRQLANLGTIQMTMSQLTATLTFDEAIDVLLPQVANIAQAETVVMYLIEEEYMIRSGVYSTIERDDLLLGQIDLLDDYPLTRQALETRQPLVILADDPRLQPHARDAFEASGVAASATIPLVGREDVVGFLALHRYRPEPGATAGPELGFTSQEIMLVETLADQATIAIEKSRLLEQLQHRTLQLQTAAQVSQAASSILSVQELVEQSVNLIRDRYDFYYVGLLLLDEDGDYAVLRAGTGQAGQAMVERGHRLLAGGDSMIGRCVAENEARIALDVGQEAVRFDNPLLPETRSEMALPLVSRGVVQGALTVQSMVAAAFSEEDVTILQSMADQLANAIANARLYAQAQQAAQRSQALYETSRALSSHTEEEPLLRTILEAIYRTLDCEHVCISIVDEEAGTIGIRHIFYQDEFDLFPDWIGRSTYPLDHPDILADVCRTGRTEIIGEWDERFNREIWEKYDHERYLRIFAPIKMLDRVLGVVEVAYDKSAKASVPTEEVGLLRAFIGQVASALQQVRLLKSIQSRARRERLLREITTHVRGSTDSDTIMRTAVRELGTALDRPAFVRLSDAGRWTPASAAAPALAPDNGDSREAPGEGPVLRNIAADPESDAEGPGDHRQGSGTPQGGGG